MSDRKKLAQIENEIEEARKQFEIMIANKKKEAKVLKKKVVKEDRKIAQKEIKEMNKIKVIEEPTKKPKEERMNVNGNYFEKTFGFNKYKGRETITIYLQREKNKKLVEMEDWIKEKIVDNNFKILPSCSLLFYKMSSEFDWDLTGGEIDLVRRDGTTQEWKGDIFEIAEQVYNNNAHQLIDKIFNEIEKKIDEFLTNGSGWIFSKLIQVTIKLFKTKALKVGSYIPLEDWVANKKALINIKNEDDKCFEYCLKYHELGGAKNSDRLTVLNKHISKYNFNGLNYPVCYDDIHLFCKNNKVNIIVLQHSSTKELFIKYNAIINHDYEKIWLYYLENEDKQHFCYVKKLSALIRIEHRTGDICCYCLNTYTNKNHLEQCQKQYVQGCEIKMPEKGTRLKFTKVKAKRRAPFIIFYDFESTLMKINEKKGEGTTLVQEHIPNSYCINLICTEDDTLSKCGIYYCGGDVIKHFIQDLFLLETYVYNILKSDKGQIKTKEDLKDFEKAKKCYICDEEFGKEEKLKKIWEHSHITGKYRGACHSSCNFDISNRHFKIPAFCHNSKGYDSHLIIKEARNMIKSYFDKKKNKQVEKVVEVDVIPLSEEQYLSFSISKIVFLDSLQFLSSSLEKLVENLIIKENVETKPIYKEVCGVTYKVGEKENYTKNYDNFTYTKKYIKEHFEELIKKGVYPYNWVDSIEKMKYETVPPQEAFDNDLTGEKCTDETYKFVCKVWEMTGCKTFEDYHKLYLFRDVYLLTDCVMNFRETIYNRYGLEMCSYVGLPSLSFDAMLKMTKAEPELLSDYEMILFLEKGRRGGLCFVNNERYIEANNKYLENYNEKEKETYIIYVDMNNLYGKGLISKLPYDGFEWSDETLDNILKTDEKGKVGYFVEVDLRIPEHLKDKFKNFPVCPENKKIEYNQLSEYGQKLVQKNYQGLKLVATLNDKIEYVLDFRMLKYVVSLGVEVLKHHRTLKFNMKEWIAPYIDKNTLFRAEAKNDFEKDLYKLMNNIIYGKSCENVRDRRDIKLITDDEKAVKYATKTNFKKGRYMDGIYYYEMRRKKIEFNKPFYLGNSVLDLSKVFMMEYHYEYMEKKYENKCKLHYTDTDSLVYSVETKDIYVDMKEDKEYFDFSDMIRTDFNNLLKHNKKVVGKMKDETKGVPITRFCALSAKCYAFETALCKTTKKAKGVNKKAISSLNVSHYKNVLETGEKINAVNRGIRSYSNNLFTYETEKTAINAFYDKTQVSKDGLICTPYGY